MWPMHTIHTHIHIHIHPLRTHDPNAWFQGMIFVGGTFCSATTIDHWIEGWKFLDDCSVYFGWSMGSVEQNLSIRNCTDEAKLSYYNKSKHFIRTAYDCGFDIDCLSRLNIVRLATVIWKFKMRNFRKKRVFIWACTTSFSFHFFVVQMYKIWPE